VSGRFFRSSHAWGDQKFLAEAYVFHLDLVATVRFMTANVSRESVLPIFLALAEKFPSVCIKELLMAQVVQLA